MAPPEVNRRAFFLPLMALSELAALTGALTPLEDAIKGTVPLFRLDNHQGAVSSNQSSSYTCFAVTRIPTSLRWEVYGAPALDRELFMTHYSPLNSISAKSKNIFARYSTLTMKQTTKSQVTCVIQMHGKPSSSSAFVKLSTDSTVSAKDQGSLHVTYGQPCRRRSFSCVTEHASCSTLMSSSPICLCDQGFRHVNTSGLCMALQAHMSACLLDHPCSLTADKCDGRCNCREGFLADSTGCRANVTLNSGCDEHRLCPHGAHCVNNVCTCRISKSPTNDYDQTKELSEMRRHVWVARLNRAGFAEDEKSMSTLGWDEIFRMCSGSQLLPGFVEHFSSRICTPYSRPGYVPWGYGCLRKFLSGEGMRKVHTVIRFFLTAVFTVAMVVLGFWLYHHSHSPSLMRERSVANWEYMPKMDQS